MGNRTNQDTGKLGEELAERHLRHEGFTITERNFPTPFGEIDLVARKGDLTIVVEVKTRFSEEFGSPFLGITDTKRWHIIKNALFYLKKKRLLNTPCRIDVLGINLDGYGGIKILQHIENAIEL